MTKTSSTLGRFSNLKFSFLSAYGPYHFRIIYTPKSCPWYSTLLATRDTTSVTSALSVSATSKSLLLGSQTHAHIVKLGLCHDTFSQNNLIKMYSKCGVLTTALKLFDEMHHRNLFSWTLIISGAVESGELQLGLETYLNMTRSGLVPNEYALGSVMKACIIVGASKFGFSIHCYALKIGMEKNPFVGTSILNFCAKLGNIKGAELVFDCIDNLDAGCWNAMVGGYANCGYCSEALDTVSSMQYEGITMDECTFVNALKACMLMGGFYFGKQLHALILRCKINFSITMMNALMDMYFKNGHDNSALKVFATMQNKDVVSWNTLFSGVSLNVCAREISSWFNRFMQTGLKPNIGSFSILLRKCGDLLNLDLGLQFYCLAVHFGFFKEMNVTSSAINMFSKFGETKMARTAFDGVHLKNILLWNELISGYSLNCYNIEALKLFSHLWVMGAETNEYTFSCILEVCCRSKNQQMGKQIHSVVIKSGFASHGYVCTSLIKCYVTFGLLDDSLEFLNGHERLDLASWGAMISALVHQGCNYEAISCLKTLLESGKKPDEYILGSILNSCAGSAGSHQTKLVHSLVTKTGFDSQVFVASAVIDAYAKCGDIESSRTAFNQSHTSDDVILYNTIIMAYAHHGLVTEAMAIFDKLKWLSLRPSQATFVSIISACSHMGLVHQGCLLFKSMYSDYGMEPSKENYGCLVDMMSRHGFLEDAKHIIEAMPFPPWPAIWRSFLSGCRVHGNRELGEWAAKKLLQLVPENNAAYVLLSKVYSEGGSWEDAAKARKGMLERGVKKEAGCSWIEL